MHKFINSKKLNKIINRKNYQNIIIFWVEFLESGKFKFAVRFFKK